MTMKKKKIFTATLLLIAFLYMKGYCQEHNILIVSYHEGDVLGGGFVYETSLYKALAQRGENVELIVVHHPLADEFLSKNAIPHHSCSLENLEERLLHICKDKKTSIVHTSFRQDLDIAQKVKQVLPIKIIATLHHQHVSIKRMRQLQTVDGVIAVSEGAATKLHRLKEKWQRFVAKVIHISPFFDDALFGDVCSTRSSRDFFYQDMGISLKQDLPIVTSIAHFYSANKNHSVLIRAIKILRRKHKMPCYLMLVGDGFTRQAITNLVSVLNLKQHVYFLGNIEREKIPELLYQSTIKALTSDYEGTGIVLLEAAMLKKPLIGTRDTGMEVVVKDGKTGVLFERNNPKDLARKIKLLLCNSSYAQELGNNAYHFVKENLINEVNVKKYLLFLSSL